MAIFHLSVQVVSRSAGKSVVAAAAYRAGAALTDIRQGLTHDYSRRRDVRETMIFAPEEAPAWAGDRQTLWTAVDAAEKRKDAQTAREVEVSLPRELTPAQQRAVVQAFVQTAFVDRGMVADVAIHEGHRPEEPNPHAHILLTTRTLTPDGFGPKNRDWNAKALLVSWRGQWEAVCNAALTAHGHTTQVDARSLADQGLDRLPTVHEGPAVRQMEHRGYPTERGAWNRAIAEYNHLVIDLAAVRAARDQLQPEVEAQRDQVRHQHGWSSDEIATLHRIQQQQQSLGQALTQALQALTVDPLVLSLAQVPDPAAAFTAQWRDAEGMTLAALAAQGDRARDYTGEVQHWEQQIARAHKDVAQVNTFFGRLFHADRLRAARQHLAAQETHLSRVQQDAAVYQGHVQRYRQAAQAAEAAWQALQPPVDQTRTALATARTVGTLAILVQLQKTQRQHPAWSHPAFHRQLVAEARTLSTRILTQRGADWRTSEGFTRFMEQLPPTLQNLQAERRATAQRDAAMRARRTPDPQREDELER